jgi:hypothetical protein
MLYALEVVQHVVGWAELEAVEAAFHVVEALGRVLEVGGRLRTFAGRGGHAPCVLAVVEILFVLESVGVVIVLEMVVL